MNNHLVIPPQRPQLSREEVLQLFTTPPDFQKYPLYWVALRGYYKKTFGDVNKNDYGVYDDAMFLVGENHFSPYNGNTDPSRVLRGSKSKKGTAILVPGMYFVHTLDLHKGSYTALRQTNGNVKVWRYNADGTRWVETGSFGINGHCGGRSSTNSEGCQTVVPIQYPEFIYQVVQHIGQYGYNGKVVPYLLVEY
jgi:hypothetical protein